MSVPPQAIGESVSAERVGSNQRSTSVVLAAWEDRKTAIRRVLPMAECGLAWGSKIDSFLYERILPVLNADKAVVVAAAVLGVEPGDIDPVRIQTLQADASGGTKATWNDPESTKAAERRHKTEADRTPPRRRAIPSQSDARRSRGRGLIYCIRAAVELDVVPTGRGRV